MAHKHYHPRHHHRHHRHNPFGISKGVIGDAGLSAAGALGALWLGSMFPQYSSGWVGVLTTGVAASAISFGGGLVGLSSRAKEELLKGGLTATIIRGMHELGIAKNLGLGLYAPSWFPTPTASDQYLRAAAPGMTFPRGAGTIFFPGPGGVPALPPAAAASLGYHRFRSRYQGNYG